MNSLLRTAGLRIHKLRVPFRLYSGATCLRESNRRTFKSDSSIQAPPRSQTSLPKAMDKSRLFPPPFPVMPGTHYTARPDSGELINVLANLDFNKVTEKGLLVLGYILDFMSFPIHPGSQLSLVGLDNIDIGIEDIQPLSLHATEIDSDAEIVSFRFRRFEINFHDKSIHNIVGLVMGRLVIHGEQLTYWIVILDTMRDLWALRAEAVDNKEADKFDEDDWNNPISYEKAMDLFSKDCSPVVKLGPMVSVRDRLELFPTTVPGVARWTSSWESELKHSWQDLLPLVEPDTRGEASTLYSWPCGSGL